MPDIYSPVLAAVLALVVGTTVCLIAARVSRSTHLILLARIGAILALLGLALSVTGHLVAGHTPGTERALGPMGFLAEHPMVPFIGLVAVALLAVGNRLRADRTEDQAN